MRIAICDDDRKDREEVRRIICEYGRRSGRFIEIEEYSSELSARREEHSLMFPFVEGKTVLAVERIIYIETDRHRNLFHTERETYSIYRKLGELEKLLEPYGFLRVHQSFLVNMRFVDKISSYVLYLKDGMEISVPKSRYPYVKEKFADFDSSSGMQVKQFADDVPYSSQDYMAAQN